MSVYIYRGTTASDDDLIENVIKEKKNFNREKYKSKKRGKVSSADQRSLAHFIDHLISKGFHHTVVCVPYGVYFAQGVQFLFLGH